jgi:serine/threonine-protein kinase RsbW
VITERICVPGEIKRVREISSKILKKLEPLGLSESDMFDIRLCVEETVRNAVEHGPSGGKPATVIIDYRIEPGKFTMEVEDEGKGFDYTKVPDPTHPDNIMKSGGRGVYLVRRLMDKVEYNDSGNKVKLTKYI